MATKFQKLRQQAIDVYLSDADSTAPTLLDYDIDAFLRKSKGLPDLPQGDIPYQGWIVGKATPTTKPIKLSTSGQALIKRWEGCRLKSYQCSANVWTIGYGHTHGVGPGEVISRSEADHLFLQDIKIFEQVVLKYVKVPLKQNQFDVLVSFCFNVGETQFKHSSLLKLLNNGCYDQAANELFKWVHAGGKRVQGLVNRRKDEYQLFML